MVEAHIQHCHPCQVVTVSLEREPLRMTPMPWEPWKEVAMDFLGPIHTEEYLRVTVCKQFRWAEVEFVTSTSARAVIPKLDKISSRKCTDSSAPIGQRHVHIAPPRSLQQTCTLATSSLPGYPLELLLVNMTLKREREILRRRCK